MTEPAAKGGAMHRQRQAGQPDRGHHRPSGGQAGKGPQQRRPGRPPGPAEHPRPQDAKQPA